MRQVDGVRQVEHRAARQHVVQVTVIVIIRDGAREREAVRARDRGVIAIQEDRVRERVDAGEVEAGLDDAAIEVELADGQGGDGGGDRRARRGRRADGDRVRGQTDDGGARRDAGAGDRLADLEADGRGDGGERGAGVGRDGRSRRDAAGAERADLVQEDTTLGERGGSGIGVGRSPAEGQGRVVGHRDIERGVATDAGVTADDAVPDGGACPADIESRRLRGGRGGRVDVIAGDREDLTVLEVVREGSVVIA